MPPQVFAPDWTSSFGPDEPIPGFANGPTSHCHPYASGVTTWMSESLLGVMSDTPGHASWSLRPMLHAVRGEVDTIFGTIRVDWAGGLLDVTVPRGTTVEQLALPFACEAAAAVVRVRVRVSINLHEVEARIEGSGEVTGRPWCHAVVTRPVSARAGRDLRLRVALHVVRGGGDEEGEEPLMVTASRRVISYPARWLAVDRTRGGKWRGVYGTLGHIIFSPQRDGHDDAKLPPGVSVHTNPFEPRIVPWQPEHGTLTFAKGWAKCALDTGGGGKGLGTAVNINATNPYNAFLDVRLPRGGRSMILSLYACDAMPVSVAASGFVESRQFGVVPTRLAGGGEDVEAGELLAPLARVVRYEEGVWLRLEVKGGQHVRFRFANVRGRAAAMVGAVMFDGAGTLGDISAA